MIKEYLENYIIEQIILLEKKEDLNESKRALLGLGILGLLGAFLSKGDLPTKTKNNASVEQTIDTAVEEKTGSRLTDYQRSQIKKGKELAQNMSKKEIEDVVEEDPSIATAFKAMFQSSIKQNRLARLNPDNKDMPIASIESANEDDYFVFTQKQLDEYFRNESNRSIFELSDGTNILDMSQEELNNQLSDQTSESVKLIAEELIMSSKVESEVTMAIVDAFTSNYDDTLEDNLDIAEIKARHEPEMLRVKALKAWLKKNVKSKEALRTLKDIDTAAHSGSIESGEDIEEWVNLYNSGEMPGWDGTYNSDDDSLESDEQPSGRTSDDYEEVRDFLN
jgi:hypothetical protein